MRVCIDHGEGRIKKKKIELKDSQEDKMFSTGTGGTADLSTVEVTSTNNKTYYYFTCIHNKCYV